MKKTILSLFIFLAVNLQAQNIIQNSDFETYSSCPVSLGEINKLANWQDVVNNGDFYDCTFQGSGAYPAMSKAYSGKGFIGFATYKDANGSAECIGQNLGTAILPGYLYQVSFVARKARSGNWSDTCSGVTVYGLSSSLTGTINSIHASQITNIISIGTSAIVSDTSWKFHSFTFIPTQTISSVLFTAEKKPGCGHYIFMDSLDLHMQPQVGLAESTLANTLISQDPVNGDVKIKCNDLKDLKSIQIFDLSGTEILMKSEELSQNTLVISGIPKGIHILKITDKNNFTQSKRLIN